MQAMVAEFSLELIGLLITLTTTVIGGVFFVTKVWALARDNREEINGIKGDIKDIKNESKDVTDRMARIETKIDLLLEQVKK